VSYFCQVCGTTDLKLKHVRVYLNWFPNCGDAPQMELLDPDEKTDHGVVLCSGCICCMAAKAMEQGLVAGT